VSWTRFDHWRDGLRWCKAVVDADELDPHQRLQVVMMLDQVSTFGMTDRGWNARAQLVAEAVAAGFDDPLVGLSWAWRGSTGATFAEESQDIELAARCAEWMEVGVSSAAQYSVPWQACIALLAGFGYTTLRRNDDAERHLESAVTHAAQLEEGFDGIHSAARAFLSLHRVVAGDVDRARSLTDGLVELPEPTMFSREGLVVAAVAVAASGDGAGARQRLRDAYARALGVDQRFGIDHVVVFAGAVAAVEGDWETAVRVLGASGEGYRRTPFAYLTYLTYRQRAREVLGVERYRQLRAEGRRLTLDNAMSLVSATS
jgi:hypothetical protein